MTTVPRRVMLSGKWSALALRTLRTVALAVAGVVVSVHAQNLPSQPITFLVPYPAGGLSDYVARLLLPVASARLGQPMVVENVSGAGGAIGVQKVVSAVADGQVVLMATPMDLVLPPLNYASVKYKSEDLKLVAHIGSTSMVLLVRKDFPYHSVEDLLASARRKDAAELKFGSLGPGSFYQIVAERFSQLAGISMLAVPYKGAAPLLVDLGGGQIDLAFVPLAGSIPGFIQEGRVKALGITSSVAHPAFPSIAPMAFGTLKGLEFNLWAAIAVSQGVPPDAAARLRDAFYAAASNPEVRKSLEDSGVQIPQPKSLQELDQLYRDEIRRFRSMVKLVQ